MAFTTDHFLHGCDYNPDQWLERPEILAADERLMPLAGINAVSMPIFSWSMLEPREGEYRFDWLDDSFSRMERAGVQVFLATPSGARPPWLSKQYPEVLQVEQNGMRRLHGARHNYCLSSPVYREKTAAMNTQLAKRYGDRVSVIGWHIGNEMSNQCHCSLCAASFRGWLQRRYGTIEELNRVWNTRFWSTVYNDWSEIDPANGRGHWGLHGLNIDWRHFVSWQHIEFYQHEVAAIRATGNTKPCLTNFHPGGQHDINYQDLGQIVDVVAWDSYPYWGQKGDDVLVAAESAFDFDLMRGCAGQKPWLLLESTTSHLNWHKTTVQKPDGFALTSALQAVAQGSQSVMYFQWRKSIANFEKQHGAIVDHAGHEHTRCFQETARVAQVLKNLQPALGSQVRARVAVFFDWHNQFSIPEAMGLRNMQFKGQLDSYRQAVIPYHRALRAQGLDVDVIDPDNVNQVDMSQYRLIVAPLTYMLTSEAGHALADYVHAGGHVVGTYWTAQVDHQDHCYLGGFPGAGLQAVFGLCSEEWHSVHEGLQFPLSTHHEGLAGGEGIEVIELLRLKGAEALALYQDGIYAGQPALTRHRYGQGCAWYQGCNLAQVDLNRWFALVLKEVGLAPLLAAAAPYGVQVSSREDALHRYTFLLNFTDHPQQVQAPVGRELLGGHACGGPLTLAPWGSAVIQSAVR